MILNQPYNELWMIIFKQTEKIINKQKPAIDNIAALLLKYLATKRLTESQRTKMCSLLIFSPELNQFLERDQ